MDWDDVIPWALIIFLVPFALAVRSIVVDRRLRAQIEALANKIAMLEHRLFRFGERLDGAPASAAPPLPEAPAVTAPEPAETVPAAPVAEPPTAIPEPVFVTVAPTLPSRDSGRRFE